jgi:uncharacterized protein YkwD
MNTTTRGAVIALIIMFAGTTLRAQDSSGGPLSRLIGRFLHNHSAPASGPVAMAPTSPQATAPSGYSQSATDPYGFTALLNRIRASAGLHPVVHDVELASWAGRNNAIQCLRGIGHHVNPCGMQNCGWNYSDASAVTEGWMHSPGHRQNLLSPSISRIGIAMGPGPYWTFNAR